MIGFIETRYAIFKKKDQT